MLDAAAKTHILRCCKVYELYLWQPNTCTACFSGSYHAEQIRLRTRGHGDDT